MKGQDPTNEQDRREFERLSLSKDARLTVDGQHYPVSIVDISLNGARVHAESETIPDTDSGELFISLQEGSPFESARITVETVHRNDGDVGLAFRDIGLKSLAALRELLVDHYDRDKLRRDLDKFLNQD